MPAVVVSVHDVAPPDLEGLRALLRALDGIGARPRVLKVVPHFAHRWSLGEDPALVQLLREEVAIGGELVLHGYTHRTEGPLRGSPTSRLRAQWFAARDPEFLSVSVVKAFFHPQGAHTWGPQLARLRRALRGRQPTTYRVLIDA